MIRSWLAFVAMVALLGAVMWASDKISYEGERTIYTVRCQDGVWEGHRCAGKLVPGDRYRFRASKSRQEVLYWIAGSTAPSGKYSDCTVKDRGNWSCKIATGQPATITHEMVDERPTNAVGGLPLKFHAVHKLTWWMLRAGVPLSTTADY